MANILFVRFDMNLPKSPSFNGPTQLAPAKSALLALMLIVTMHCLGCAPRTEQIIAHITSRRAPALAEWERKHGSMSHARRSAEYGSALVLVGAGPVEVRGPHRISISFRDGPTRRSGTATCLSDDGYYLTAAHLVSGVQPQDRVQVVFFGEQVTHVDARVVWIGDENYGMDLAILQAPGLGATPLAWEHEDEIQLGVPMLSHGFSNAQPRGTTPFTSGRIADVRTSRDPEGRAWSLIISDIPLAPGDSGGPVVSEHGKLIGIGIGGGWTCARGVFGVVFEVDLQTEVCRPSGEFIEGLVEADRRAHGG